MTLYNFWICSACSKLAWTLQTWGPFDFDLFDSIVRGKEMMISSGIHWYDAAAEEEELFRTRLLREGSPKGASSGA